MNKYLVQAEGETRIEFLLRVLRWLMANTPAGAQIAFYDEAECDGLCLADDIAAEVSLLDFSGSQP